MPDTNQSNMLTQGSVLDGRYEIERYISSGGFGHTYIARDLKFRKTKSRVAVKEFFINGASQRAASDYSFAAIGATSGLKCGTYELVKLEGEGRAQPHFVEPAYTAGCPQLEDSGYPVYTQPSWKAVKGTITIGDATGIAQVSADQLHAYTVGVVVYIDFKQPGNYEATLYTVAGQRVCTKTATISTSDRMRLTMPQSGIYVLRDGKPVAAAKLLR